MFGRGARRGVLLRDAGYKQLARGLPVRMMASWAVHMGCSKPQLKNFGNLVETRSDVPTRFVPALVRQHYERQAVLLPELHLWWWRTCISSLKGGTGKEER